MMREWWWIVSSLFDTEYHITHKTQKGDIEKNYTLEKTTNRLTQFRKASADANERAPCLNGNKQG